MRKKFDERIPRYTDLILPTFLALKELGGSGKNDEILTSVIQDLNLSDEIVDFPHKDSTSMSELSYQLAWARTYLKKYGVIENSARCVVHSSGVYTGNNFRCKENCPDSSSERCRTATKPISIV